MLSKKTILFRQVSAIFLLLLLSAVHIVQVAHSHKTQQQSTAGTKSFLVKKGVAVYHQQTADNKCFICEYQLAKDVDANFSLPVIPVIFQHQDFTAKQYSFAFQNNYAVFETRGPPQIS